MIERDMVRHEIEDQFQPMLMQSATERGKSFIPAEHRWHRVLLNGVRRTSDVVVTIGVLASKQLTTDFAAARAGRPNAHQPNVGKATLPPKFKLALGNI